MAWSTPPAWPCSARPGAARRGVPAPRLARWLLALGIGATLAANVTSGLRFGPVGRAGRRLASDGTPDATEAARVALEKSITTGDPLSQRELARRYGIPRSRASVIAREVSAAAAA